MLKGEEQDLFEFFKENMESEASIIYKKEPGMDGNTTLQVSGFGAMLFDGACIILKKLAMADAKQCGDEAGVIRYVDLVRDVVVQEIMQETGTGRNGGEKS